MYSDYIDIYESKGIPKSKIFDYQKNIPIKPLDSQFADDVYKTLLEKIMIGKIEKDDLNFKQLYLF